MAVSRYVEEVQMFLSLLAESGSSESLIGQRGIKKFSGVTAVEAAQL